MRIQKPFRSRVSTWKVFNKPRLLKVEQWDLYYGLLFRRRCTIGNFSEETKDKAYFIQRGNRLVLENEKLHNCSSTDQTSKKSTFNVEKCRNLVVGGNRKINTHDSWAMNPM